MNKFYDSQDLIHSPSGRMLRIMSEYIGPQDLFKKNKVHDTIVFFGSARTQPRHLVQEAIVKAKKNGSSVEELELLNRDLEMSRYYEDARELAYKMTKWSKKLKQSKRRFIVATGGGPGIMEAANRGAAEAKGLSVGLNISLPFEQSGNPYISHELEMEFHYFFMRKYWFVYLAKALLAFPGGFGTFDELFETLTLIQTKKTSKSMPVVLFGTKFWDRAMNMEALAEMGTISPEDLDLMYRTDSVDDAFNYLTKRLSELYLDEVE
ncbi:MAG: LOG family protein [Candidatus Marinimicrobia bacterium]|nr:LOG family protein [Candidatus Neomarinimicrobiota bacterium]MCF7851545.1 LOG family protein [Candidatus Neomarinimicrobiota bacterium]MCF7905302.1 LOG family protein [Candidatus Neomarinimicrobiota bacterium]